MHRTLLVGAIAALGLTVSAASAQVATFDFEDNTDQGWGSSFGADGDINFQIVTNPAPGNNTKYLRAPIGGFQVGAYDANSPTFVAAMNAAALALTVYAVSYDWYIDTSLYPTTHGNFLQLGSYLNGGNGWYSQNFGAVKEVELNGTQLASGGVFSGHVDVLISAYPPDNGAGHGGPGLPAGLTFYRLGLIENGDGTVAVDFDNVSVHPIPEPASMAVLGLGLSALAVRRRHA